MPRATVSGLVVVLKEKEEFWVISISRGKQEHISAGGER